MREMRNCTPSRPGARTNGLTCAHGWPTQYVKFSRNPIFVNELTMRPCIAVQKRDGDFTRRCGRVMRLTSASASCRWLLSSPGKRRFLDQVWNDSSSTSVSTLFAEFNLSKPSPEIFILFILPSCLELLAVCKYRPWRLSRLMVSKSLIFDARRWMRAWLRQ